MKGVHVVDAAVGGFGHPGSGGKAVDETESKILQVSNDEACVSVKLVK